MKKKRRILNDQQLVQKKILETTQLLSSVVGVSLGPYGKNVMIQRGGDLPLITNDGVTIAKEISVADNTIEPFIQTIIQSANSTNNIAGDGTTTATILACQLIVELINKQLDGFSHRDLKKQLLEERSIVIKLLNELSMSASLLDISTIKKVITISLDGDIELTEAVLEAILHTNAEKSLINFTKANKKTHVSKSSGFTLPAIHRTDISLSNKKQSLSFNTSFIPILGRVSRYEEVGGLLQHALTVASGNIVIIAEDFSQDVLDAFNSFNSSNHHSLNIFAYTWSVMGERKQEIIEDMNKFLDIYSLTNDDLELSLNGNLTSSAKLQDILPIVFDQINKSISVIINRDTIILSIEEDKIKKLSSFIYDMKEEMIETDDNYIRKTLQDRIDRATCKKATIKIYSDTISEYDEKSLRVEDAINSAYNAVKGGVLPGGGSSLLIVCDMLEKELKGLQKENHLMCSALKRPSQLILANADMSDEKISEVQSQIIKKRKVFNLDTDEYEDFSYACNVLDTLQVEVSAISNAVSVALSLLSTGALILNDGVLGNDSPYVTLSDLSSSPSPTKK